VFVLTYAATTPKPLPAPLEEDPSFYSAVDQNGRYTTWRQMPTPASNEAATEEFSSAVVLSFTVRASEDARVCFGPAAATDASLGLELALGKANNTESSLSVCGTVVSSCAHAAAGILDPTEFVPFQISLFPDQGRVEVAWLWPLLENSGAVTDKPTSPVGVAPFLSWEVDPEILEQLTKYGLTGGTTGRVFFRSIHCVQSKVPPAKAAQCEPQESEGAAASLLSVDKMELAQEWPTTDLLLERPSFACLNGALPNQHRDQQHRRGGGGGGGGLMTSAHVWAPASCREEYASIVAANMDESAVLQQLETVSQVLETLYARTVLSCLLSTSPSETLSALEQCVNRTSNFTSSSSSSTSSSNVSSDKNEPAEIPQSLEQLFVLLSARKESAKVLKPVIAEALSSNSVLSAKVTKMAVCALHEATVSEAPDLLFRMSASSDEAVVALPALPFAKLVSDTVLESLTANNNTAKVGDSDDIGVAAVVKPLVSAWVEALKSGSASLKFMACRFLTHFLRRAEDHDSSSSAEVETNNATTGSLLAHFLEILPTQRLASLTAQRLAREREAYPAVSPYLKALIELLAQARAASTRVGTDMAKKNTGDVATALSPPLDAPPAAGATALRFSGGTSGLNLSGRSDLRHDGTVEFWLQRTGPSKGARLASSPGTGNGIAALLLRCSVASGRPGCVGYLVAGSSSNVKEVAFEYEVPAHQLVHLAFVHHTRPVPMLQLYANGVKVGEHVLTGGPLSLPSAMIGDLRHSFQGLLYGVRYWRSALMPQDLASAATKGPDAKLMQSYDDCVCDLNLQQANGCLVCDRTGDAPIVLGARTSWVPVPCLPWPLLPTSDDQGTASLLPSSEVGNTGDVSSETKVDRKAEEEEHVEEAKVVGVFTRKGVGNGQFRKAEREPVTLIYQTISDGVVSEGAATKEEESAIARISGTLQLHDSALTAEVVGSLEVVSGSLSFTVQRFTKRGRLAKVDASTGKLEKEWLLGASFKGMIEARKLSGTWQVALEQATASGTSGGTKQEQEQLPTARVEFSSQRKSACLSLSAGNTAVRMDGREKWGSVLLLHRGNEKKADSAPMPTDSVARSRASSSPPQATVMLDLLNKSPNHATVRTRDGLPRPTTVPPSPSRVYFEATITASHAWRVGWMAQEFSSSTTANKKTPSCTVGLESKGSSSELQLWKNGVSAPYEILPTAAEPSSSEESSAPQPQQQQQELQQEQQQLTSAKTVPWRVGSVIGCMLELESCVVRFALDGVYLGVADVGHWCDEVAHTGTEGATPAVAPTVSYHPMVTLAVDSGCSLNFGATPFAFAPPNGYMSWNEAFAAIDPSTTSAMASTGAAIAAVAKSGGESTDTSSGSGNGSLLIVTGSDIRAEWHPLSEYPSLWIDTIEKPPQPTLPTCRQGGQWHWEFSVTCVGDEGMFGGASGAIGVCRLESALGQGSNNDRSSRGVIPGQDAHSWAYLSSGDKIHSERSRNFGPSWRNGDVIGLELDLALGTVSSWRIKIQVHMGQQ